MTTQKSFALIVLASLVALVASPAPAPAADVPVHSVPSPAAPAPVPSPIEAAGGLALAAGAVATAMADRRRVGLNVDRFGGATAEVWAAIETTLEVVPGYFESHLEGRSAAGDGSTVWRWGKACPNAFSVLNVILDTLWAEYPSCPNLIPGCKAFKAAIPGTIGLYRVDDIAPLTPVRWVNPGHGYQYPVVGGANGVYVDYTTLIVGEEGGREVVFTFHPGDPIQPTQVPADFDTGSVKNIVDLKAAIPGIEWIKTAPTA